MQTQARGFQICVLSPAVFSTLRFSLRVRCACLHISLVPIFLAELRSCDLALTDLEPTSPVSVFLVLEFGGHTTMPSFCLISGNCIWCLCLRNFLSWFAHADSPPSRFLAIPDRLPFLYHLVLHCPVRVPCLTLPCQSPLSHTALSESPLSVPITFPCLPSQPSSLSPYLLVLISSDSRVHSP